MHKQKLCLSLMAITIGLSGLPALADVTAPNLGNEGRRYSKESANSSYYGTGPAGRLTEASMLRYQGEQDLDEGNIELALQHIGKAVHLDPGDPDGHFLYARALTEKFYRVKGPIDEELLNRCILEWKVIWRHDADTFNQANARTQCRKLMRIAKDLEKHKKELAKLKEQKQLLAQKLGDRAISDNVKAAEAAAEKPISKAKTDTDIDMHNVRGKKIKLFGF
jgi:hypothetical protein